MNIFGWHLIKIDRLARERVAALNLRQEVQRVYDTYLPQTNDFGLDCILSEFDEVFK